MASISWQDFILKRPGGRPSGPKALLELRDLNTEIISSMVILLGNIEWKCCMELKDLECARRLDQETDEPRKRSQKCSVHRVATWKRESATAPDLNLIDLGTRTPGLERMRVQLKRVFVSGVEPDTAEYAFIAILST